MLYPRAVTKFNEAAPQIAVVLGGLEESDANSFEFPVTSPALVANPGNFPMYFMLISAGYVLPWTAICSKVSYFTEEYGANYFVMLNVYFYVSGLPVTAFGVWYDHTVEMKYESKFTYLMRSIVCLTSILILVMLIPFASTDQLSIIVGFLGMFTWAVHNSHALVAALVQLNVTTMYQQVGYALPAVISLILNFALASPSFNICLGYFSVVGAFVLLAAGCAIKLIRSRFLKMKVVEKDRQSLQDHNLHVNHNRMHQSSMRHTEMMVSLMSTDSRAFTVFSVKYHMVVLFFVIYCSVLEGAFISYVQPVGKTLTLPTILYFVRVFGDLLGRPLSWIKCLPSGIRQLKGIAVLAFFRVSLMAVWFIYIYWPTLMFRSDAFIVSLQLGISLSSGFLVSLIYESAANKFADSEADRTKASERLSLAFQIGATSAALTSLVMIKYGHQISELVAELV